MMNTVSDDIRKALRLRLTPPPPPGKVSMRTVAALTGVPVATISRFLQGKTIHSDALDRLAAFVEVNHAVND